MKVMMVIAYDGSKFYGFQRQKDVRNVQGYLENTLSDILDEDIIIKGAGRTDRGVHAYGQVVHFETNKSIRNLKSNLNKVLKDCYIKKIKIVDDEFHARHSVKNKIYLYKISLDNSKDSNYFLNINNKLDIKKMKDTAKLFLGDHNFKNFVAGERDNYNTYILKIKVYKKNNILYILFKGVGFYRYMVRNLVGALLEVGKGKQNIDDIKEMLNNPEQEKRLTTVSPNGLYLIKINYK